MKVVICIPTYNERESLPGMLDRTRIAVPEADILVIDDNSPDGTGEYADARAGRTPIFTSFIARPRKAWGAPIWRVLLGQLDTVTRMCARWTQTAPIALNNFLTCLSVRTRPISPI